jgi:hypothetical protein
MLTAAGPPPFFLREDFYAVPTKLRFHIIPDHLFGQAVLICPREFSGNHRHALQTCQDLALVREHSELWGSFWLRPQLALRAPQLQEKQVRR